MLNLARWCIEHRRRVVIGWVAIAVLASVLAGAVGRNYATNFSLPGTESQRAQDLLSGEFKTQSGDQDTIVFHTSQGTIDSQSVRGAMAPLLSRVSTMPHVVGVVSPYGSRGKLQVSHDRKTAFATVSYDKRANLDALVIRCVLVPAVLELIGATTWKLPRWIDERLPHINIEGSAARAGGAPVEIDLEGRPERELTPVGQ